MGVPVGLALLAGLAYLVQRRSKTSKGRDKIKTHLDDSEGPDVNQMDTHEILEVSGNSMPMQLPEQGVVELPHLREYSELAVDQGIR